MARKTASRRRPAVHITMNRAARLHRLVAMLSDDPKGRDALLAGLAIGLRTFYRELELLRRCGVRIRLDKHEYRLSGTSSEAEGRLPFPDPHLSFAEMAELSLGTGDASKRLASLLASVIEASSATPKSRGRGRKPKSG